MGPYAVMLLVCVSVNTWGLAWSLMRVQSSILCPVATFPPVTLTELGLLSRHLSICFWMYGLKCKFCFVLSRKCENMNYGYVHVIWMGIFLIPTCSCRFPCHAMIFRMIPRNIIRSNAMVLFLTGLGQLVFALWYMVLHISMYLPSTSYLYWSL